ncbi:hypothetical protein T492DRAFT_1010737 [Pavlovales sp. CCMP2436]|nr:hypothetical protein T492DRAFT_1010737 [Pavlovales sp. CCMP2436]
MLLVLLLVVPALVAHAGSRSGGRLSARSTAHRWRSAVAIAAAQQCALETAAERISPGARCWRSVVSMAERPSDAGRMKLSSSDSGMENINKVGPSEARIAAFRSKVEKLKGMDAAMREGEALLSNKKPRAATNPSAAACGVDKPPEQPTQTASSIGGVWQKPAEVQTYQPSTGSWGVFDRPADISAAFGGGKQVGVGAAPAESAEEKLAKQQATEALLAKFRQASAAGENWERKNVAQIEEALAEAKNWMRAGEVRRCARTLEPVWRNMSAKTELGGRVGLDLAMAYDANQETSRALEMYEALASSRSWEVKRLAKQLKFGIEAMQMLGVEAYAGVDITGYAVLPELALEKSYEQNYVGSTAQALVDSPAEAMAVLRIAASERAKQLWTPERVKASLAILRLPENRRVQQEGVLTGVWRLVLQVGAGGEVSADERLSQTIGPSANKGELRVSRLRAVGPLVGQLEGVMCQRIADGPDVQSAPSLRHDLQFDSYRVGLLRLPGGGPVTSTVLVLDATLLVTQETARGEDGASSAFYVWAQ